MGDARQNTYKKFDVVWIQLPVMLKEAADRTPGVTAVEHTVAKLQRIAHKLGGGVVAAAALVLKPWLGAGLCEQHCIDRMTASTS